MLDVTRDNIDGGASPERAIGSQELPLSDAGEGGLYSLYMIAASSSENANKQNYSFQRYDFDKSEWTVLKDRMPEERSGFAVATYGNQIWVIGGCSSSARWMNSVVIYDPEKNLWRKKKRPMTYPRRDLCAVVIGRHLFAIGGTSLYGVCDFVEVWNGKTLWQYRAPLTQARTNFSAGEIHGQIYVVGGQGRGNECLDMEYYCPRSNCWTIIPGNSIKWPGVRAAVLRNVLYFFNGGLVASYQKDNNSVSHYVPSCADLGIVAVVPFVTRGYDVVAGCRTLYVVGGLMDEDPTETTMLRFQTHTRRFVALPNPLGPPCAVKAALVKTHSSRQCCKL